MFSYGYCDNFLSKCQLDEGFVACRGINADLRGIMGKSRGINTDLRGIMVESRGINKETRGIHIPVGKWKTKRIARNPK